MALASASLTHELFVLFVCLAIARQSIEVTCFTLTQSFCHTSSVWQLLRFMDEMQAMTDAYSAMPNRTWKEVDDIVPLVTNAFWSDSTVWVDGMVQLPVADDDGNG